MINIVSITFASKWSVVAFVIKLRYLHDAHLSYELHEMLNILASINSALAASLIKWETLKIFRGWRDIRKVSVKMLLSLNI